MNPLLINYHRSLLQAEDATVKSIGSPVPSFTSTSPFDSSLALTILVLLTVLFFMAFFSLYIRRFSNISNSDDSAPGSHPFIGANHVDTSKRGAGLDAATVRSLPVVQYGGSIESKFMSDCSICLSEFEEKDMVKVIPYCGHGFHPSCIDMWLSSHVSCPLCRSNQLFPDIDRV
uniref:RING-H2 finger protein ATL57-like n=1 Tax=Erigeron canadensis TaxID=72917 RepID=UPI001CB898A8|nr:RING-H2 finger protein ATL57-like [Erigeron canadensis]